VVTGFALCTAAHDGSFDISIGRWCGGVPSSLMVPVMLPPDGGAALTFCCESMNTKVKVAARDVNPAARKQFALLIRTFSWGYLFSVGAGAAAAFGLIGFSPSWFAISLACVCIGCNVRK